MIQRVFRILSIALFILTLVRLEPSIAVAAGEPLLVIAGLTFQGTNISLADLKTAFRGQVTQVSGKRVIPINHPLEAPLRVAFDRAILGLEPAAVGRFWVDRRIRDEGNPPTTASSPELAVRIVASLPGAVSYASKALLNPKVKVIAVDGKAAGQAGYPL